MLTGGVVDPNTIRMIVCTFVIILVLGLSTLGNKARGK